MQMTDKKTETYEAIVAQAARAAGCTPEGTDPVVLRLKFYFLVPKSRARSLTEGSPHIQRPDLDNCIKSIKDGLNGVAWRDDCCVTKLEATKVWTHKEPGAEVEIIYG